MALPLFRLARIGVCAIATLADLNTAIVANTDAIQVLTATVGTLPGTDFTPQVDQLTANTAAVNAAVGILTGSA